MNFRTMCIRCEYCSRLCAINFFFENGNSLHKLEPGCNQSIYREYRNMEGKAGFIKTRKYKQSSRTAVIAFFPSSRFGCLFCQLMVYYCNLVRIRSWQMVDQCLKPNILGVYKTNVEAQRMLFYPSRWWPDQCLKQIYIYVYTQLFVLCTLMAWR